MTQEDKLKQAKELYKTANEDQKYVLESLFPELKESEDVRIRKKICKILWNNAPYEEAQEYITWLEKQGEQKPAWSEEDERWYRRLHNLIYSTQYCDSRNELSDWLESLKERALPQPKQEWGKEDEKCLRLSADIIDSALRAGFCVQLDRDRCVDWLKSLRPQNT